MHSKVNRNKLNVVLVALLCGSLNGCAVSSWLQPHALGPEIFTGQPSLAQAVDVINSNTNAIREAYAEGASISVQGFPALRANLALQRPNRMRMQASVLGIGGPALDVGSNDELFWFWRQPLPNESDAAKGVFFAKHEDAQRLPIHRVLPIEPRWIIEALGMVTIDPTSRIDGPFSKGQDHFEIRDQVPSARGMLTRVLVIHNRYGWIMEQSLMDSAGAVLAESHASRHRYYPDFGVTLPEQVDIVVAPGQPQQMSLQIIVGQYVINQLNGDPETLFEMPEINGYANINLAQLLSRPGNRSQTGLMQPGVGGQSASGRAGFPQAGTGASRAGTSAMDDVYRGQVSAGQIAPPRSTIRTGRRRPSIRGLGRY